MSVLEFRSAATGGFYMMSDTFRRVCEWLDRDFSESGCWLPEDLPPVIERLDAEMRLIKEQERLFLQEQIRKENQGTLTEEEIEENKQRVNFAARLYPLLDMLECARKKDKKVMWGVP